LFQTSAGRSYGADLREANLSGADLSGADLSGADLSFANLSTANAFHPTRGSWGVQALFFLSEPRSDVMEGHHAINRD
jgi:Pentapeptide repeats (8 copies)